MSGEKLNEKDSEKNASSDRPNPFAINVGNLLTGSNPERAIGDAIEKLVVQRKDWETNELAAANDGLYRLLQHCLARLRFPSQKRPPRLLPASSCRQPAAR